MQAITSIPDSVTKLAERLEERYFHARHPQEPIPDLHALVIGIDEYETIPKLSGAVADADSINRYLAEDLSVPPTQITNLRNREASRSAIIGAFRALQENINVKPLTPIVIYYAGHGSEVDTPNGRNTDGSKTQCLVPQDVGKEDSTGNTICPIPDYTLSTLLHDLAEEKGNNITVIFDCCHSASSTRGVLSTAKVPLGQELSPPGTRDGGHRIIEPAPAAAGARYVPSSTLPDLHKRLDDDILTRSTIDLFPGPLPDSTPQAAPKSKKSFRRGMRSHVLLAACGHGEYAYEQASGHGGYFTAKLLHILRCSNLQKLTYRDCMKKFPRLNSPGPQNPVCEGEYVNRFFFNASVPGSHRSYIPIARRGKDYILQAGLAQGITGCSRFSLYAENTPGPENPELGTFEVFSDAQTPWQSYCELPEELTRGDVEQSPDSEAIQAYKYGRLVEPQLRSQDFKIYHTEKVLTALQVDRSQLGDPVQGQICWVDSQDAADVILDIDDMTGHVTFSVRISQEDGLQLLPHTVLPSAASVQLVLSAISQWIWHVSRAPDDRRPFRNRLQLEFYKRQEPDSHEAINFITDAPELPRENLINDGLVTIVESSENHYGLRIVNNGSRRLYAYPFYFSSANLSIRPLFLKVYGSQRVDAPLDVRAEMTMGCEDDDLLPLSFQLGQNTKRDLGILRVFVTTSPADFESVGQPSPFATLKCVEPGQDEFLDGIWLDPGKTPEVVVVEPKPVPSDEPQVIVLEFDLDTLPEESALGAQPDPGSEQIAPDSEEAPILAPPTVFHPELVSAPPIPVLELWDVIDVRIVVQSEKM